MMQLADRRPAATLIVLLLLQGALLSIQVRNEQGQRLIHSGTLLVLTPLAALIDTLVSGAREGGEEIVDLWQTRSENSRLKEENTQLRLENARLRQLESLLPRLRAFEPLSRTFEGRLVLASVFWDSPEYFQRQVFINAASLDGVREDCAVLSPLGIVGRVREATPLGSSVELITNPGASAGALVGQERWPGILSGDGSPLLKLDFISNAKNVNIGDAVIASGSERIYPRDFPVGKVVQSEPGPMGQLLIRVQPAADLVRLEEVAVILPAPEGVLQDEQQP